MYTDLSYPSGQSRSFHLWFLFWGCVAFLIPFLAQYNYIMNAFYYYGTTFRDAGSMAKQMWRNEWYIPLPFSKASYFVFHYQPHYLLINQLSFFIPMNAVEMFAVYIGGIFGLWGLVMYVALSMFTKELSFWHPLLLAGLAVAFTFNGIIVQGIWLMHHEYDIPLFIFLFLLNYALGNRRLTILFFVLALIMREDAGLHLAAPLALLTLLKLKEQRSFKAIKREVIFITAAVAYSIFAFWMTSYVRSISNFPWNVFNIIYSGSAFFDHLSLRLLVHRLIVIIEEKPYLWVAAVITLFWAIRTRNPYLIVGFAANIPWFLVNWLAVNDNTGKLYAYYIFPFLLSVCWPIIATAWQYGRTVPQSVVRQTLCLQVALIAVGLMAWDKRRYEVKFAPYYVMDWGSVLPKQTSETYPIVDGFIEQLYIDPETRGTVMVDEGVMTLIMMYAPQHFRESRFPKITAEGTKYREISVDALIYFYPTINTPRVLEVMDKNNLTHHYCVRKSWICMLTKEPFDPNGKIYPFIQEMVFHGKE